MCVQFPRATTWPIGGEDFVIDVILLKRIRRLLRERGLELDAEAVENVLLEIETLCAALRPPK